MNFAVAWVCIILALLTLGYDNTGAFDSGWDFAFWGLLAVAMIVSITKPFNDDD